MLKRRGLIGMAYVALFLDALANAFPVSPISHLLLSLVIAYFISVACIADAAALGRRIPFGCQWQLFCLWPIGVPIYLVRYRKWRGLGLMCLFGFAAWLLYVFAFALQFEFGF